MGCHKEVPEHRKHHKRLGDGYCCVFKQTWQFAETFREDMMSREAAPRQKEVLEDCGDLDFPH
jgi:hypothetical protein